MSVFKKIIFFLIPAFLIIAIFLKSNGVDFLAFDDKYWKFASRVLQVKEVFTLSIPSIPMIPASGNGVIDGLTSFINFLSNIINVVGMLINIVLEELAFMVGFLNGVIQSIRDLFVPSIALSL